ncbi:MAG: rhodanese-like domain-containing protein [Myxococcales bacterium]|nr:rhodanese-like domain-containing protein [Myxococcales bacterium]
MSDAKLSSALFRDDGPAEVTAEWVQAHLGSFDLIDVREAHELVGELGAITGAQNIPMAQFLAQIGQRDKQRPTVVVCRSGRRSGTVVGAFESAGYTQIASLQGGMIAWHESVLHDHDVHLGQRRAGAQVLDEAVYKTNGLPEVSPDWVAQHFGHFRLIDCRQADELTGPLGHLTQAEHVPLGDIPTACKGWDKAEPTVILCRSGGRSGRAALHLLAEGFRSVASMEGGMIAWNAAGLPRA